MKNKKITSAIIAILCIIAFIVTPITIKMTHSLDRILFEITRDGSDMLYWTSKGIDDYLVIAGSTGQYNVYILDQYCEKLPLGYKIGKKVECTYNNEFEHHDRSEALGFSITLIEKAKTKEDTNRYLVTGIFDKRYNIDEVSYCTQKMHKIETEHDTIFWLVSDFEYNSYDDDFKVTYKK